jgi:hypothetical protein
MQEDNLTFLKRNLTTKGFDDATLHANLENQLKQGQPEFKLMGTAEFKRGPLTEKVDYELAFKKSDQSDKYFFNSFKATLKNDDPSKEMSRDFYLRKGRGFTKKEAYNLLGGRAVYKEMTNKSDEVYKAWVKLDFMKRMSEEILNSGNGDKSMVMISRRPCRTSRSRNSPIRSYENASPLRSKKVTP